MGHFSFEAKMKQFDLEIGLLFSTTGSYETVARSMHNGATLACREIESDAHLNTRLVPFSLNPGGRVDRYPEAVETMVARGIRHIIGCYTSSSRKEVIPFIEKADALLWYPTHYEGFEATNNVIYTGAAPNHHMSPLIDFLFGNFGRRAFCIGSNYIWGWESNRVLREGLQRRGGEVLAERYVPVGETDMDTIVDAILAIKPDFVFNALIGVSSYSFFRTLRRKCRERGIDQASRFPVASCNLSEPELEAIGAEAIDGHISSSVYFSSLPGERNNGFVADYAAMFPEGPVVSAEAEGAYIAVNLLARSIADAGTTDVAAVKRAVIGQRFQAPQGLVSIDPQTFHATLTPRIGRSRPDGRFDILVEASTPVRADPYLVRSSTSLDAARRREMLRAVS